MHRFDPDDYYLEEWYNDKNRVRLVKKTANGDVPGAWFSRLRHTDSRGYLDVPDSALPRSDE